MALAAQAVGSSSGQIGIGKQVGDRLARQSCLAEFIAALKNMSPFRPVGTVRARPAELAIVVAVMAIGAQNLCAHGAPLADAIEVQHICPQTGLGQRTAPDVHHGMA